MIETDRLILRPWRDADRPDLAALNADARVMAHFPGVLDRPKSDAFMDRLATRWDEDGFCFGAIERRTDGVLLGLAGLSLCRGLPGLDGAVEIGWRLAFEYWGQGYAREAAQAWIAYGFTMLSLPEIVSFTAAENARSMSLMLRLGFRRHPSRDFEHPSLPPGHRLRPHLLHALSRDEWIRDRERQRSPATRSTSAP